MEQCENFKEDPMETNPGQEVNYGQRGWHRRGRQTSSKPTWGPSYCLHHKGQLCALFLSFLFRRAEKCLWASSQQFGQNLNIQHIGLKMWCMVFLLWGCIPLLHISISSVRMGLWGWVTVISQCACVCVSKTQWQGKTVGVTFGSQWKDTKGLPSSLPLTVWHWTKGWRPCSVLHRHRTVLSYSRMWRPLSCWHMYSEY